MPNGSDATQSCVVVKPHIPPRDGADGVIAATVGCFQTLVLFLLPSAVVGLLTGKLLFGIVVYGAFYGLWLLLSVARLELSPAGIRFVRVLGTPKFLTWSEISVVEPVSPRELVLLGWLWPPFPAREMTFSLTCKGHYAIRHGGGVTYFPPSQPEEFERRIAEYHRGLTCHSS